MGELLQGEWGEVRAGGRTLANGWRGKVAVTRPLTFHGVSCWEGVKGRGQQGLAPRTL